VVIARTDKSKVTNKDTTTNRRNTNTAEATLPAARAAIILSPPPPPSLTEDTTPEVEDICRIRRVSSRWMASRRVWRWMSRCT
jgi:hypothetical protein